MIHARALARTFTTRTGPVEAVRGVDLDVEAGEIVGFLGPNGAGKTTTLRMLTTLLAPTSGTAQVAGHDLLRDPVGVRRRIGYVAQGGVTLPQARAGRRGRRPGTSVRRADTAGDAPRAGAVRPARPRGPVGPSLRVALRRPAPPTRHRHGPGPLPRPGLPRRAHHRARPAVPREPVGAHPQPARPPRRHGLPHDPLPRRGRRPLRPPAGDRQRRHRRRRDAGGAQARRVGGRRHPHPQGAGRTPTARC